MNWYIASEKERVLLARSFFEITLFRFGSFPCLFQTCGNVVVNKDLM